MKNITTYVGVDAHKKDLFIAMLGTRVWRGAIDTRRATPSWCCRMFRWFGTIAAAGYVTAVVQTVGSGIVG